MLIIEDILLDLLEVKCFSVFDVKDGFWYVCLDYESFFMIIFNSFFGRFCWFCMFFGINIVLEEF